MNRPYTKCQVNSPAAHTLCLHCHAEIDPGWNFCPDCGQDNRPPEERPLTGSHDHVYPSQQFCVVCGRKVLDVDDMGRPVNRKWEGFKSVVGFIFSLFFWRRRGWWWWDE